MARDRLHAPEASLQNADEKQWHGWCTDACKVDA
jgi:hypothetical protein